MGTQEPLSATPASHFSGTQDLQRLWEKVHFPKFDQKKQKPIINVNKVAEEQLTMGQKIADAVAANMGSWRFIIIQSLILATWIVFNVVTVSGLWKPFDPYPFILLNLALSFQAAFAAPFIMISQNRQAEKDRLTAQNDYQTDCRGEEEVRHIMEHLDHQDTLILRMLSAMQLQQQRLEQQHKTILALLKNVNPEEARQLEESSAQQQAREGIKEAGQQETQ